MVPGRASAATLLRNCISQVELTVMCVMRFSLALCLTAIAWPANTQPTGDLGWSTLENRHGASVDFPGGLFAKEVSADSDRMIAFTTADGRSRFELFSIPNNRGESPAQFARRADSRREKLDYKRVTRNFIAASTIRNGRVLYRRCNFSLGMIHCIDVRYPAAEERAWDNTVTRISLSLRPR